MTKEQVENPEFKVNIIWTGGHEGDITLNGKPVLRLSSPVIWEGKPDAYSPQDLFISAVAGCYITTFAVMMKRVRQTLNAHHVTGRGVLHKHPDGGWYFTEIFITMNITIPKDANLTQVKRAVSLTEKYCQISRSVTCMIHVEPKITQLG